MAERQSDDVQSEAALREQTAQEALHWRLAAESLADLDTVAAPEAWASIEVYLRHRVRDRLSAIVAGLVAESVVVERKVAAGGDVADVRRDVLRLRSRYLQCETVLDFFGDAINTRTNGVMRDLLRGFDVLASDSIARTLEPLGIDAPPALVYVDKGLGAAILRAGVRLWDSSHPSPAAAIKLTRHNLSFPTALLHETGHQVAHLTGWASELSDLLRARLNALSREVAELWASWSGEIAADVHAFAQAGWTPVFALANVVDGATVQVYRDVPGDPHPYPFIRVMFNVALCRAWFGPGPWDRLATAWVSRHPAVKADGGVGDVTRVSVAALRDIVDVCTRVPMNAFHGQSITGVLDPRRVAPGALSEFAIATGDALTTSNYLRRRDPLRVFAALAGRSVTDPAHGAEHAVALRRWISDLGSDHLTAPTPGLAA
jgi:hypothetical protein